MGLKDLNDTVCIYKRTLVFLFRDMGLVSDEKKNKIYSKIWLWKEAEDREGEEIEDKGNEHSFLSQYNGLKKTARYGHYRLDFLVILP